MRVTRSHAWVGVAEKVLHRAQVAGVQVAQRSGRVAQRLVGKPSAFQTRSRTVFGASKSRFKPSNSLQQEGADTFTRAALAFRAHSDQSRSVELMYRYAPGAIADSQVRSAV